MANLGACCVCQSTVGVIHVVMLPVKGSLPGCGWGCEACDLSSEGALAVLCYACVDKHPVYACAGPLGTLGRVPVAGLLTTHTHRATRHPALYGQDIADPGGVPLGDAEFARTGTVRFLDQQISRVEETMRRCMDHVQALVDRCGRLEQAALEQAGPAKPRVLSFEPKTKGQE